MASRRGSTLTANNVLFDTRLSLQAVAAYGRLLHVAWLHRPDRSSADITGRPIAMPPLERLAELVGIPVNSLKRYINELRKAGHIETQRPRRDAPLVYTFLGGREPADGPTTSAHGRADYARASLQEVKSEYEEANTKAPKERSVARVPALTRPWKISKPNDGLEISASRAFSENGDAPSRIPWDEVGKPPPLPRNDEGRSVAFDTLAEVCGVNPASPRTREVAAALNGRPRSLDAHPGINRLFWLETALHFKVTLPDVRARAAANPDGYHAALAAAIRLRAGQYRRAMPGATLTPLALAKWWLDVEGAPPPEPGMTADEIRAYAESRGF